MKRFLPFLMLFGSGLWAQSRELWVSGGKSILSTRPIGSPLPDGAPDDVQLGKAGYRFGFRFDFGESGHFAHEIQYAYNRTSLTDQTGIILGDTASAGTAIHQAGYNFLYYMAGATEDSKVRPFLTAGVHFSDFVLPGSAAFQGSSVKFGFNYGIGMKMRISPLFSVRFDIRGYDTAKPDWNPLRVKPSGLLQQSEASAGLGIHF